MAPKKAKIAELDMEIGDSSVELDQAIDDLRGVLKADENGASNFDSDFPSLDDTSSLGSDFGLDASAPENDFGGDAFGTSDFGSSDFGGSTDFGDAASEMNSVAGSAMHANMDLIMDIPIDVQIILGSSRMQVSSLMNLTEGAIISLDRKIGEPVDLIVNGRLIGRGEITVMESDETRFGIKLIEVKSVSKPQ